MGYLTPSQDTATVDDLRAQLAQLERERSELPRLAARAALSGDEETYSRLLARRRALPCLIAGLRVRIGESAG